MAMNFNDLIGPKSRPGSIQNFVRYKPVPGEVVLEEAQALIFQNLRVREMKAHLVFQLFGQAAFAPLPSGYLEAISMQDREGWNVIPHGYVSEDQINRMRSYDQSVSGALTASITAAQTTIPILAAGFPRSGNFSVFIENELVLVTAGHGTNTWTAVRGHAGTTAAAHGVNVPLDGQLTVGTPTQVAVFAERFQFDCKADTTRVFELVYFQKPPLLSVATPTNFLTVRYPNIVRVACQAGAASFMKDAEEFQARAMELLALCNNANAESDLGKAA